MSVSPVVTLGYGSFGSVHKLPTLGYGIGIVEVVVGLDETAFYRPSAVQAGAGARRIVVQPGSSSRRIARQEEVNG